MKSGCVYRHTGPTGKVYIGVTSFKDPEKRYGKNGAHYLRKTKKGEYVNRHFAAAIIRHGGENFTHEILLENRSQSEACYAEKYLIAGYKIHNISYNIQPGGFYYIKPKETLKYGVYYSEDTALIRSLYYEENKQHIAEYKKQGATDNKEHLTEYKKQYYQDNKEKVDAKNKKYAEEHREQLKAYKHRGYEEHKEELKQRALARREEINARRKERYRLKKEQANEKDKT